MRYLELDKRRPYQTRHTAATLMLASENPNGSPRFDHANTDMLFRVYSRFVPNLTRQDGRAFAGLINSQSAGSKPEAPNGKQIDAMDAEAVAARTQIPSRTAVVAGGAHPP